MNESIQSPSLSNRIQALWSGRRSHPQRPMATSTRAALYVLAACWLLLFSVPIVVIEGGINSFDLPSQTWQGESRETTGDIKTGFVNITQSRWEYTFKVDDDTTVYHGETEFSFYYFPPNPRVVVYNPDDPSQNYLKTTHADRSLWKDNIKIQDLLVLSVAGKIAFIAAMVRYFQKKR
ncbi:MAG: hypothetical protein ACPHO6_09385, partial [Candidatus Latescibacterota bacterium]